MSEPRGTLRAPRKRPGKHERAEEGRPLHQRAAILAVFAAVVLTAAAAVGLAWNSPGGRESPGPTPTGTPSAARHAVAVCERLVVPAYFEPSGWPQASDSVPPPSDMILDISGTGAGPAPQQDFRTAAGEAQAAGVTVLGYISTVDGQRPLAEAEAEVAHYAAWYGVTSIFLDRVSGEPAQLGYYRALAAYIRAHDPGGQLWLNPGDYPDQAYMSLGEVMMTFEGTYAQYAGAPGAAVPGWVRGYPAARFAHTIYAASAADLRPALRLAAARNAGHVYVTDGSGGNPYQALPGYWAAEDAAAAATCVAAG
ncbi:MAG TPA: spherulation-specific family 4 protein [Trebonia sp.]